MVKNHTKNPTQNSTFFHKTLWIISMDTGKKVCKYKSSNDHTTMTVQIKLFVGVEKLFYM